MTFCLGFTRELCVSQLHSGVFANSRILENRKYCGNAEFDKIIDDETFTEAIDAKSARQVAIPGDLDVEIYAVKNHVRCIRCGSIMTRKVEKRCPALYHKMKNRLMG